MKVEGGRTRFAVVGFVAGALLAGVGLTAYLVIQGREAARIMGVATLPTDRAGWWALAGLSAALGAAVGAVGALAAWLLSHPRPLRRPRDLREQAHKE